MKILVSGYQVDVAIERDHVTITFRLERPNMEELVQYQDYAMASAVAIIYGLLSKTYPIRGCYFLRRKGNQQRNAEYSRYYGCQVALGSLSLSLTTDISILSQDVMFGLSIGEDAQPLKRNNHTAYVYIAIHV